MIAIKNTQAKGLLKLIKAGFEVNIGKEIKGIKRGRVIKGTKGNYSSTLFRACGDFIIDRNSLMVVDAKAS
ncbi:MAG: hypothetical protein SPI03_01430 [Campylobacter sputorum]|uniref:hypothetical protein n=1 Tax=Campylobacter sputorum TaxID=206 RepID=UPI002A91A275|nr:hypothetical protein [Campylobacter sputorum]MDY6119992.1 hypothetical protein [Campylobacter sputorum]